MLAELHHVGTRAAIAPAGIEPATSGFKVRRLSPAETPGLHVAAAIATGMRTSDSRYAQRARNRPSIPPSGTNADQIAASLIQHSYVTLGSG